MCKEKNAQMWVNEEEEGVHVGKSGRRVCVWVKRGEEGVCAWVNEGEEGVCVGEQGRGGFMCG